MKSTIVTGSLCATTLGVVMVAGLGSAASGTPTFQGDWESQYPMSTLPDRMSAQSGSRCNVCHHPTGRSDPGNCYKEDMVNLLDGGMSGAEAIAALDGMDSDGDGWTNGEEANRARTDSADIGFNPGLIGTTGVDLCSDEPGVAVTGVNETPCGADLAPPEGLDFFDVLEYLGLFDANDPRADLVAPVGLDFFDVLEYLGLFDAGCP